MLSRPICEPVELPPGAAVLAEQVTVSADAPANGRLLHFHDVAELVIFRKVAGAFLADGKRHALRDGALIFAPSMRHHDFALKEGAKAWVLVQIDPTIVEALARQPGAARLARPFCAQAEGAARARIDMLADWLTEAAADDPTGPETMRLTELLLLAAAAAPEDKAGEPVAEAGQVDRLLPVVERLRREPGKPIALEEAAALCHLSPAYFSRRFSGAFGMGFADYARAYRLHLAARRLVEGGAAISEIAYGLGFASPSHFTARFGERFGMTPREYRNAARKRGGARGGD